MGRGLSELQKTILQLAYQNHVDEGRELPRYRVVVEAEIPEEPVPEDPVLALQVVLSGSEERYLASIALRKQQHERIEHQLAGIVTPPCQWRRKGGGEDAYVFTAGEFDTRTEASTCLQAIIQRDVAASLQVLLPQDGADLYTHEILIAAFGFGDYRKATYGSPQPLRYHDGERCAGGIWFDRQKIGAARYNAAVVSVSRALERLETRGLVESCYGASSYGGYPWRGIDLTREGLELATELSANKSIIHEVLADSQGPKEKAVPSAIG